MKIFLIALLITPYALFAIVFWAVMFYTMWRWYVEFVGRMSRGEEDLES